MLFYKIRQGGFERRFICCFNRPSSGGMRIIPLNGKLTEIDLFKKRGNLLAITAWGVLYLLGKDQMIGQRSRKDIDKIIDGVSPAEKEFLGRMKERLLVIYDSTLTEVEGIKSEFVKRPKHPTREDIEMAVEMIARKVNRDTSIVSEIIKTNKFRLEEVK